jgi:uncharacterized protein (TIGR03067 family)
MCSSKMKAMVMLLVAFAAWMQLSRMSAGDDLDLLRGQWRLVSLKSDRFDFNINATVPVVLVFAKEQMTILRDGKERATLRIRINETARPKEYDLSYEGDDPDLKQEYPGVIRGIYEIDGDKLRRCYTFTPDQRPTKFEVQPESGNWLQVLERVKSAPDKGPD